MDARKVILDKIENDLLTVNVADLISIVKALSALTDTEKLGSIFVYADQLKCKELGFAINEISKGTDPNTLQKILENYKKSTLRNVNIFFDILKDSINMIHNAEKTETLENNIAAILGEVPNIKKEKNTNQIKQLNEEEVNTLLNG